MPDSQPSPQPEHSGTYFVQDRSSKEEITRLQLQDTMITNLMGGVLAEQPSPRAIRRLIDVGCGTGGWLIAVARTYPEIELLVGIDISERMIEHARAQAEQQGVSERVTFYVVDALNALEFPTGFFDLVNQRLGSSYLRTQDWPRVLQEYQRITRPQGSIRITETNGFDDSNSESVNLFTRLFAQAFERAGHVFPREQGSMFGLLGNLLQQWGLQNVQTRTYEQMAHPDTEQGKLFIANLRHIMQTARPFLHKWDLLPDDYEAIYQQALLDMQQPGFKASWTLITAWGETPGEPSLAEQPVP